jgi:hypothetical protein
MPENFQLSNVGVNTEINALAALLNGGWLDLYDGPQPVSADLPPSKDCHLLASLRFADPAFSPAVEGVVAAYPMEKESSAKKSGFALWYRLTQADHETVVADGSVGTTDANLVLNVAQILERAEVMLDRFMLMARKSKY